MDRAAFFCYALFRTFLPTIATLRRYHMTGGSPSVRRTASALRICVAISVACMICTVAGGADTVGGRLVFPMPKYDDAITLPVTIGGKQRLFIVDSGSSGNVYHNSLRPWLGEPVDTYTVQALDGDEISTELFSALPARIGSEPISDTEPVVCVDLANFRAASGLDIEGILGMSWFRTNVVQLDFDRREVAVLPLLTMPTSDWGRPVTIQQNSSGIPVVQVRLNGTTTETCRIDTGYTGTTVLRSDIFSTLSDSGAITLRAYTAAATLSKLSRVAPQGTLAEFELAGFVHKGLLVTKGGDTSRIGLDYLRRYRVTFDLGRGRVWLEPGSRFDREEEKPAVGAGMIRRDGKTVITSILADSPAERAGIQADDELVSVAGEPVDGKPMAEIRSMLREKAQPDGLLLLVVRRGGVECSLQVSIDR
jgi:hypothetical protein